MHGRVQNIVEVEDLIQQGMEGLVHAAQKYSPKEGVNFSQYAQLRIRGSIIDFLRKNSKNIEYTLNYKQVVGQYSGMLLDTADTWLIYTMKDYDNQYGYDAIGGEWYVQILTPEDGSLNVYDLILGEVKNQCQFVGRFSSDFIFEGLCYDCQSPNFQDGKICFKVKEHPANRDSQIIGFVKR